MRLDQHSHTYSGGLGRWDLYQKAKVKIFDSKSDRFLAAFKGGQQSKSSKVFDPRIKE